MAAPEPICIVGPTAVGKSGVAAEVAERLGGEVVGADAYQVYRGLDLLTAKPDAETLARVPHHLIGEVPLEEEYDVNRYREMASARMEEIAARGKVAVVCGGTGLYVRALTHGLAELPGADAAIRAELEAEPLDELQRRLQELDPVAAGAIDMQNPRRLVRAIEVCLLTGKPFSSFRQEWDAPPKFRGYLLVRSREELHERIARRTEEMFERGVVDEVRAVLNAGSLGKTAAQAIGVSEIRALLAGEIGEAECRERIALATRQYAKRQMTWFRKEKGLVEIADGGSRIADLELRRIAAAADGG